MIDETKSASLGSNLSWYLIHTKPRQEARAVANRTRQGFVCYMPFLKLERIRQRKLAESLGVSLGKANFCMKAMLDKGMVKMEEYDELKAEIELLKQGASGN